MFTVETIWLSEQKRNRLTDCNRAKVAKDETGYRSFFYLPNNTESKYYYKPHAHIPTYSAAATRCFIFCQPQQSGRLSPHFSLLSGSRFFFHLHHFLCSLHFVGSHFTLHKKMRLCWLALMPRSNDTRVFASERSDWNKMKTKRRVCWPLAAIR